MSYRSGHTYSEYPQHHPHNHGRTLPRRATPGHSAAAAATPQTGYTLVHAGKQVRIGPVVFWIVVGAVTLLGMWSAATATYFAFRDDVPALSSRTAGATSARNGPLRANRYIDRSQRSPSSAMAIFANRLAA